MPRFVRLTLDGPEARPGTVAAGDVARAILGLERALQRAASLIAPLRRRRGTTGRHTAEVERAAKLRFVVTGEGSFRATLALPDDPTMIDREAALPLTVADLSDRALERVLDSIESGSLDVDRELAAAIAQLGDELGVGERTTYIAVERVDAPTGEPLRRAVIDRAVRERMKSVSQGLDRPSREELLTGSLVEADFERFTARLRSAVGASVEVTFTPDLADVVQSALRRPHEFDGLVQYDRRTHVATSIALRRVLRGRQPDLADNDAFWRGRSFDELAREQGIDGPPDLRAAVMTDLTDEERELLIQAVLAE
jgi:hypothetical protein